MPDKTKIYCEDCKAMRLGGDVPQSLAERLRIATCRASVVPQYGRISREFENEEKLCSDLRTEDTCVNYLGKNDE